MVVLEGADTVLVLSEAIIDFVGADASRNSISRHATYVFRKSAAGHWLCVIDNSYGTDLLKEAASKI
jgi:ketosteroid isomerase-like protein